MSTDQPTPNEDQPVEEQKQAEAAESNPSNASAAPETAAPQDSASAAAPVKKVLIGSQRDVADKSLSPAQPKAVQTAKSNPVAIAGSETSVAETEQPAAEIHSMAGLEGDLEAVDRLFAAGFRMMAPVHFFDNEVGGSAHGTDKAGLSEFGRQVIARQEELGIAVDLAHASAPLIDDVLAVATKPVINSHTGVAATCPGPRNLTDTQLRRIAETDGVIGIAFFETAVCGKDVAAVVAAIQHAVQVAGIDHVGFGSDFDGAVGVPWDVTGIGLLTEALRDAGFSEDELRKLAGENVARVLGETLPER